MATRSFSRMIFVRAVGGMSGEWAIVNSELIHHSQNDAVYYDQRNTMIVTLKAPATPFSLSVF
ncbi:MAG: hypothetical protein J0H29_25145 [Sphingobacteriales bacterium]|nr:hypothetical protein [Sphingobacteriales bacterium]